MFCPSCGKENAHAFGFCNACGRPLAPVPGAAPPVVPAPSAGPAPARPPAPAPVLSPPKKTSSGIIAIVVIVLIAGLGALGYFMMVDREAPEARIARIMREAAGLQPVKNAFWSSNRRFDDAIREEFRKLFQMNREYAELASKIDAREVSKVGTPESLVDPSYAAGGVRQLHQVYMLDREIEQKVMEIADNLRRAIEATDWSAANKAETVKEFDRGFAASLEKRHALLNAEQSYVEATDNLYEYANAHYAEFQLQDGQLRTVNDSLLPEFNARMETYNARRTDLLRAKEDFNRAQADTLGKMGVSSKDVGLQ